MRDSNPQPKDYESSALTVELTALLLFFYKILDVNLNVKKILFICSLLLSLGAFLFAQTTTTTPTTQTENILLNSKVVLTASAEGTLPITFNWYKNDVWIGLTDSITLEKIQLSDAGTYKIVATNVAGTAESAPLAIVVIVPVAPNKVKINVTLPIPPK